MSHIDALNTRRSASHQFNCHTCGIQFVTADLQRQHMKSEWHRYNLKRKIAQLPSIDSEQFAEKVLARQLISEQSPEVDEFGFVIKTKKLSKKFSRGRTSFPSTSALRAESPISLSSVISHLTINEDPPDYLSNRDTDSELYLSDLEASSFQFVESDHESFVDAMDNPSDEEVSHTMCVYCGQENHDVFKNLMHMYNLHGLYIPEKEYLKNPSGLVEYIGESIIRNHKCLVCGFKGKSLLGIRQHLQAKGHCRLPYEWKEEKIRVSQFYDFENEADEISDLTALIVHPAISLNYTTVHIDPSGVEMILPSGARIGHRSMMRYFKQNLPLNVVGIERAIVPSGRRYSPGFSKKQPLTQEFFTRRHEARTNAIRERRSKMTRINYQPHYRDPMLGSG